MSCVQNIKKEIAFVNEDEDAGETPEGVKRRKRGERKLNFSNKSFMILKRVCGAVGTGASSPCARIHPGCWKTGAS